MIEETLDADAIVAELDGAFEDERLNRRLAVTVRALAKDPSASLPSLCTSAELEGAYRFFSNVRVTPERILEPHFEQTHERAAKEDRVLVAHDTTDFTFRVDGARKGLGRSRKSSQTFYGHFSLVLAANGSRRPLGLADMMCWTRGAERSGREHDRWLAQIKSTDAVLRQAGAVPIHVCDREADDYYTFHQLLAAGTRFVVRAETNRWTVDEVTGLHQKLQAAMASCDVVAAREAQLSRRRQERSPVKAKTHPARAPRTASLLVSAAIIHVARPSQYTRAFPDRAHLPESLPIHVVRVWEPSPPEGCTPVEWFLYTNEPIATAAEVLAIVDHYRARWVIEEYFKALKTGCAYESRQLEEYESLLNALAVSAPIAYEALRVRTLARATPDAPASTVASHDEIEVLRALGRRPLPLTPTARDVLLAIAALGGHIKYAPDPGWLTIYRGRQKLELLTEGWVAANAASGKLPSHSDQR
jgi:hypothetical protein